MAGNANTCKRRRPNMANNKVKTRFDSTSPNKNKIATLSGITKTEQFYMDILEFKVEVNGVEQPMHKFFSGTLDRIEHSEDNLAALVEETKILRDIVKLQQKMVEALDKRLKKIESEGNL